MQIVKQSFEILTHVSDVLLSTIELYGRVCYKSECRITPDSATTFVKTLIDRQHESVIEHVSVTVRIVCDRGISHELVRHRIASYSQESTRYCDYHKAGEIMVIDPEDDISDESRELWVRAMEQAEQFYFALRKQGVKPQIARDVLPTALKTEIIVTMNLRSWRNFFKQRTARSAHPRMQRLAKAILAEFKQRLPVVFDDIN